MPRAKQATQRPIPTEPQTYPRKKIRRARLERTLVLLLLFAFVMLGLFEVFGPKTSNVTATANGYTLKVTYPAVTRPGLPVRWEFEVRHPGGFSETVRIRVPLVYYHLFDFNGFSPDPSASTSDDQYVTWAWDAPDGDVMKIEVDALMETSPHQVPRVTTSVVVGDTPVVTVTYKTRVMP